MIRLILLGLCAGIILPAGATAQSLEEAARRVTDCRSLEDADERLACFDETAAPLSVAIGAAENSRSPSEPEWAGDPVEKAKKRAAKEEASRPLWARVLPKSDPSETPDSIKVNVVRILRNNVGRHYFFTEDGEEWEQVVAEQVRPPESLPAVATISESMFGSPKLTFDNGPTGAYGVKRVD